MPEQLIQISNLPDPGRRPDGHLTRPRHSPDLPLNLVRPRLALLLILTVALAILGACGGQESVSVRQSPVDFETCAGFLDLAQVVEAAGRDDVSLADRNPNSGAAGGPFTAVCVIEFVTPDIPGDAPGSSHSGPSLTLWVLEFATVDDAESHHRGASTEIRSMRDIVNPDAELVEGALGSGSYAVTLDEQGVGTVLGFREGGFVVSFNTTVVGGDDTLVPPNGIESLARLVRANLTR